MSPHTLVYGWSTKSMFFFTICVCLCVYVQRKGVSSNRNISHSCYPMVNICKFVSLVPILFGFTPIGDAGTLTNRAAVCLLTYLHISMCNFTNLGDFFSVHGGKKPLRVAVCTSVGTFSGRSTLKWRTWQRCSIVLKTSIEKHPVALLHDHYLKKTTTKALLPRFYSWKWKIIQIILFCTVLKNHDSNK